MSKHPELPETEDHPLTVPLSPLKAMLARREEALARARNRLAAERIDPAERQATIERVFGKELADAMTDLASGTHEARKRVAVWRRATVERMAKNGASLTEMAAAIGCSPTWTGVLRNRLRLQGLVP